MNYPFNTFLNRLEEHTFVWNKCLDQLLLKTIIFRNGIENLSYTMQFEVCENHCVSYGFISLFSNKNEKLHWRSCMVVLHFPEQLTARSPGSTQTVQRASYVSVSRAGVPQRQLILVSVSLHYGLSSEIRELQSWHCPQSFFLCLALRLRYTSECRS